MEQLFYGVYLDLIPGLYEMITLGDAVMHTSPLPLNQIRTNPAALREVNKNSPEFLELIASVRLKGVMNAICVREQTDPVTGAKYYGLIDGLHRFTAATEAGLVEIPAVITSMDDAEVEEAQIMANIHRIETKPVEYSKGLLRMLTRNPMMTESELANKLAKSPGWLKERLNLVKLKPNIQKLVDEGTIKLANAYSLAKLPEDEQEAFAERAATMQPGQFLPVVNGRVKELRDAARQGREAKPEGFVAVAHLRKVAELRDEAEKAQIGPALLKKNGIKTVEDAFTFALKWALHLDPDSIEVQKAEDEKRRAKREEDAAKAKVEREKKKAEKVAASMTSLDGHTPIAAQ